MTTPKKLKEVIRIAFVLCLTILSMADAERGAFSTTGAGTRGRIFGEAFVAIADDANATQWNPAGIPSLLQTELTFSHASLFAQGSGYLNYGDDSSNIDQDFIGVVFPDSLLPFGISYVNIGTHGLITADDRGVILDTNAGYAERLLTLSVGKRIALNQGYGVGVGLNFNRYWVDARQDRSAVGIDGGMLVRTPSLLPQAGMTLTGLTRGFSGDGDETTTIPARLTLGIAYHFLRDQLVVASGFSKTVGGSSWQYALGGEYQIRRFYPIHLSIRTGYRTRGSLSEEDIDSSVHGWSSGLSLHINRLKLDYAYEPHTYLGDTHRMTISILPNTPAEIYWQRGLEHDMLLEDEEALEAFQRLLDLNPKSAAAYHRMALIYERQRHIDDAIRALQLARKVDANYFDENGLQQIMNDLRASGGSE